MSSKTAAFSVPPKGAGGEKAVRWKMRPCLDGLTDELTLRLFMELDFGSLAAVKRVTRRFNRIASDPSILGRVSIVQWMAGNEGGPFGFVAPWGSHDGARDGVSRFHTDHLGSIRLPEDEKEAARKFLEILERLLEKGASVVSLQLPIIYHGGVAADLPALLDKHKVRLEALACGHCERDAQSLVTLLRSQPGIAHLCPGYIRGGAKAEQLLDFLPSLRHMSLHSQMSLHRDVSLHSHMSLRSQTVKLPSRLLELAPRLRSVVLQQSVAVDFGGVEAHVDRVWKDFQRKDRGRRFLLNGAPWDPWDEARHPFH